MTELEKTYLKTWLCGCAKPPEVCFCSPSDSLHSVTGGPPKSTKRWRRNFLSHWASTRGVSVHSTCQPSPWFQRSLWDRHAGPEIEEENNILSANVLSQSEEFLCFLFQEEKVEWRMVKGWSYQWTRKKRQISNVPFFPPISSNNNSAYFIILFVQSNILWGFWPGVFNYPPDCWTSRAVFGILFLCSLTTWETSRLWNT